MKKFILIFMMILLVGCQKDVEVPVEEEVIPLDLDQVHNVKHKIYNNTLPHIIKSYVEMDDDKYGTYKIEMYDTNYESTWAYLWRDLNVEDGDLMSNYVIYENYIVVNVQGAVSVHNLATGEFLWEIETHIPNGIMEVADDMLYVLGYEEDFLTGISLENGKVEVRVKDGDYLQADALKMKDQELIAYIQSDQVTRSAVVFDSDGSFIKKFNYMQKGTATAKWDKVESSDESDEAIRIIDGDVNTFYSESVKGYGEKEWIELTRVLPTTVNKLRIVNGNNSSEKAYNENAKLRQITLSVGDGKSFTYKFETFEYGYIDEICFVKPVIADYVLLTIDEVEPGELYKNTSFSELETE